MPVFSQRLRQHDSLKILMVEDNQDDRDLYKRLFQKRNDLKVEIHEALTVKDALVMGRKVHPDCILLDYLLPDASGIDFIKQYREENEVCNAAIVMVTGQGSESTATDVMKLGALDYIIKSPNLEDYFIQTIVNAIECARLRVKLSEYQHKLETKNKELTEFAYTASHDLKAPLRRISSYCEFLREETYNQLDSAAQGYIDRMTINVGRLQRLVDDLLTYSIASYSKGSFVVVDMNKIMLEVLEDLGTMIAENNARIIYDSLPQMNAEPIRIKELFENLISNAIKYRSDKSPVIKIDWADKGEYFIFSVADNGLGIDSKYAARIFKPFQRLHTQEEIEGSGLGLSICMEVVHKHFGEIWVEPNPEGGSIFFLTIAKFLGV